MSEGERGREREREGERERERVQRRIRMQVHSHTLRPYYYVLYTHPERDQCYNESRQSVPDASSGPGQ